nr:unnamed protein product [Callosobruchus chinensis]
MAVQHGIMMTIQPRMMKTCSLLLLSFLSELCRQILKQMLVERVTMKTYSLFQLQYSQTNISSNIESIENRLLQLQQNTPSTSEASTAELLERFRRFHNIVIRGVPETSDRDDASTVSTIIGLTDDSVNAHITGISRLGSTSSTNRTRPLMYASPIPNRL